MLLQSAVLFQSLFASHLDECIPCPASSDSYSICSIRDLCNHPLLFQSDFYSFFTICSLRLILVTELVLGRRRTWVQQDCPDLPFINIPSLKDSFRLDCGLQKPEGFFDRC